jgi:hypothetical protein
MASSLGYEAGDLDGIKPSSSSGGMACSSHRTAAPLLRSEGDTPFTQVSAGRDMATKIVSRDNYCINYIEQRCKEPGEVLSVSLVNTVLQESSDASLTGCA